MSAKIILFDVETTPLLGWAWQNYDTNIIKIVEHWHLLSIAYKELSDDTVSVFALPDFPGYTDNVRNDFFLVSALWKVLDNADIVVAHNGDHFDIRFANARFMAHGLPPPSPYKTVDTLKIARKHFKFESNKLADLGTMLGVGTKVPHTGFKLWEDCMRGPGPHWDLMKDYNAQDTVLLEEVYLKLRPWATTHPNVNLFTTSTAESGSCPSCGSHHTQKRGFAVAKTQKRQRLQCQDCSHWFTGDLIKSKT